MRNNIPTGVHVFRRKQTLKSKGNLEAFGNKSFFIF